MNYFQFCKNLRLQKSSVADPDPDPPDPHVRGMDPDPDPALDPAPSIIMQKILRITLIPTFLLLS